MLTLFPYNTSKIIEYITLRPLASSNSARYYDPTVGRWTQQDPIAGSLFNANGLNCYTSVGDDPLNQADPRGTCTPTLAISQQFYGTIYTINSCAATLIAIGAPVAGLFGGPPGVAIATIAAADIGLSSTLRCNGSVNIIVPLIGASTFAVPTCL